MSRIFITIDIIILSVVCFGWMSSPSDPSINQTNVTDSAKNWKQGNTAA